MYSSAKVGVPAAVTHNLTEPQGFHFATDDRIAKFHETHDKPQDSDSSQFKPFKATNLRKEIFEKKLGIPEKKKLPVTEAKSPAITKTTRKVHFVEEPKVKQQSTARNLKRKSNFKLPGEKISEQKRQKFQEQIDHEMQEMEAARSFHSNPLPTSSPDVRFVC